MAITDRTLELVSETTGVEPVTLAEMKSHLRVVTTGDNDYISELIKVARRQVETDARRKYVKSTFALRLGEFPTCDEIMLENPTVASISSITYTNSTGGTSTLSTSTYELDKHEAPGHARLKYGQSWPATRVIQNAVTVNFISGSTSASDTPVEAKHAIKLLVADMYCDRGSDGTASNRAYNDLIGMFRWGDYR